MCVCLNLFAIYKQNNLHLLTYLLPDFFTVYKYAGINVKQPSFPIKHPPLILDLPQAASVSALGTQETSTSKNAF